MLDFDSSRRPSRPSEWVSLLDAVYGAEPSDESDWIEWKSSLDLSNRDDLGGALAKAMLAFSNRMPLAAQRNLDGSAIVIVGVSPREVKGVVSIDNAVLEARLIPFIGADGPRWDPHWLTYKGVSVLVVEVMAPAYGDPIWAFRSNVGKISAGAVYVRRKAASEPAQQLDFAALIERSRPPVAAQILDIEVGAAAPAEITRYRWTESEVDEFLTATRVRLLSSLRNFKTLRAKEATDPLEAARQESFRISMGLDYKIGQDAFGRSPEHYEDEVDKYIESVRRALPAILLDVAATVIRPTVFVVTNKSEQNYKDLRVTIKVDQNASAARASKDNSVLSARLPEPPHEFGPRKNDIRISPLSVIEPIGLLPVHNFFESKIVNRDVGFQLELLDIDLRPRASEIVLEDEVVVLVPVSPTSTLVVSWEATASNIDKAIDGSFKVPFSATALDILRLSQAPASADYGD